jgi:hypothetical protein
MTLAKIQEDLYARFLLLLFAIPLLIIVVSTDLAAACDLQPPNKNPKDVVGLVMPKGAAAANFIIAADADRYYDLVDEVDGLTFGFGNWPQQQAEAFFADMARVSGGEALNALEGCLSTFFAAPENRPAWSHLETAAKVPTGNPTPQAVDAALKNTILSGAWMKRYSGHCTVNCGVGEANFFREQQAWFVGSMHYALADRQVIQWQVDYWNRTVIAAAEKMASDAGMKDDEPAMVGFAAYASSSPGWSEEVIAAAKSSGKLKFGNYVWDWALPPGAAPTDSIGLQRWHYFIIWQYYVENTRREQLKRRPTWEFRPRSKAYYNTYLKDYWILGALDARGDPIWNSEKNLDPALVKPKS